MDNGQACGSNEFGRIMGLPTSPSREAVCALWQVLARRMDHADRGARFLP